MVTIRIVAGVPEVSYANLGLLRGAVPWRWQSAANIRLDGSGDVVTGGTAKGAAWITTAGSPGSTAARLARNSFTTCRPSA
jgi:hypothetical protein